jgi:ATP-binding cassette subfamily C (CFTR/MRP) protein 1
VALVYDHALIKNSEVDDSKAITLVSSDIETVIQGLPFIIDVWSRFLQIGLGIYFLWMQLGPVSIAPIIVVCTIFYLQKYASSFMPPAQVKWMEAVQRRVGLSKVAIQNMKSVKLSGLVESMIDLIQSERERELAKAKTFRWLLVWANVLGE